VHDNGRTGLCDTCTQLGAFVGHDGQCFVGGWAAWDVCHVSDTKFY